MRRKKPRVVWLPSTNANSIDTANPGGRQSNFQRFELDLVSPAAIGDFVVGEIALVIDDVQDPLAAGNPSLSDIEGSGYRLRRIVGNIFCAFNQVANATVGVVAVTAGIIVRQVDPKTALSLAQSTGQAAQLAPGEIQNISDPWIWRRTWLLTNILSTDVPVSSAFSTQVFAGRNYGQQSGSASQGSYIDAKTARVIGPEHRLFLDVEMQAISPGTGLAQENAEVSVLTDLRVLGSLRSTTGNRRNASR